MWTSDFNCRYYSWHQLEGRFVSVGQWCEDSNTMMVKYFIWHSPPQTPTCCINYVTRVYNPSKIIWNTDSIAFNTTVLGWDYFLLIFSLLNQEQIEKYIKTRILKSMASGMPTLDKSSQNTHHGTNWKQFLRVKHKTWADKADSWHGIRLALPTRSP